MAALLAGSLPLSGDAWTLRGAGRPGTGKLRVGDSCLAPHSFPPLIQEGTKRDRKSHVTRNFALIPTWAGRSGRGGDPGRQVVGGGGRSGDPGKGEVCLQDTAGSARSSRREKSVIPAEARREVALVAHPILPCERRQQKSRGGATPAAAGGGALRPVSLSAVRTRWREGRGAAPGGGRPVARGKPSSGFGVPRHAPFAPRQGKFAANACGRLAPAGPSGSSLGSGRRPSSGEP